MPMPHIFRFAFLFWITFQSLLGLGSAEFDEQRVVLSHVLHRGTEREQEVRLNLRRLPRPGGVPVILTHATVLTNLAMRTLGKYLWDAGFDVWMPNLRGHGNGDERTDVRPYYPGDYSFDKMVTEDLPKIHKLMFFLICQEGRRILIS